MKILPIIDCGPVQTKEDSLPSAWYVQQESGEQPKPETHTVPLNQPNDSIQKDTNENPSDPTEQISSSDITL